MRDISLDIIVEEYVSCAVLFVLSHHLRAIARDTGNEDDLGEVESVKLKASTCDVRARVSVLMVAVLVLIVVVVVVI